MTNQDKQHKIYIHATRTWEPVSEDIYRVYYRDIWAIRKRAQTHGQCMCPKSKIWLCDGDCLVCEFRAAGDNLSLDYTIEDGDGNRKNWKDDLQDDTPDAQSIIEDHELLEALYQKLDKLDPNGRRICELIMDGKSERDISSTLNVSRNTYTYRRDKLLRQLRDQLNPYI